MDYAALKTYILANYPAEAAAGADEPIAPAMNSDTVTGYKPTEIGVGTILEAIGLAAGNGLLDVLYATPDFRHVKPLLEQGRLRLDSALVRGTLDGMVTAGALTQANADKLKAVAQVQVPAFGQFISNADVAKALRG